MGLRLVDELLYKSSIVSCHNFRDTAEVISKIGFKMYLNMICDVTNWSDDNKTFSLIYNENPLTEYVELPSKYKDLKYSNIICGVLRGSLEMVQMKVECEFIKDILKGDDTNENRVTLKEIMRDNIKEDE